MQSTTMRRTSARTAIAVVLAIVGMLALGGAWTSASAEPGNSGNTPADDHRPADGSVGNANDKDPNPQSDNKNGPNKGHECDDNKGIGQDNPAHTRSCATTNTIPGSTCTIEPCDITPGTPTVNTPTSTPAPQAEVLGLVEERPASPNAAPQAQVAGTTQLAFTGSTTDVLGFLALALLAFGGAFILLTRKPQEITTA